MYDPNAERMGPPFKQCLGFNLVKNGQGKLIESILLLTIITTLLFYVCLNVKSYLWSGKNV